MMEAISSSSSVRERPINRSRRCPPPLAGHDPHLDLLEADPDPLGSDAEVAGHGHLEAPAKGIVTSSSFLC